MAPDPKLTAKVMKLKWSKGISLKEAWKRVSRPKTKKDTKTKEKRPKKERSSSEKKPKKEKVCSCKKEINGKMRTVYTSSRGAKYYKSKGMKVYVK